MKVGSVSRRQGIHRQSGMCLLHHCSGSIKNAVDSLLTVLLDCLIYLLDCVCRGANAFKISALQLCTSSLCDCRIIRAVLLQSIATAATSSLHFTVRAIVLGLQCASLISVSKESLWNRELMTAVTCLKSASCASISLYFKLNFVGRFPVALSFPVSCLHSLARLTYADKVWIFFVEL